jgi:hypothetical protein
MVGGAGIKMMRGEFRRNDYKSITFYEMRIGMTT